jgi:hypothetical protein
MGLRFQRRVRVAKGARLNIAKQSVSLSAGGRWFGVNLGRRGLRTRASIPGTGISWVSSQSRGGDGLVGLVLVGGVILWLVSVLATILLIVGLAALTCGLICFVGKHVKSKVDAPKLSVAGHDRDLCARAPPPETTYRALVPVDPAVFEDPTRAEVAALETFNAWVRQLPKGPRNATDTVRALNLRTQLVGRLVSKCVGRRVVWCSEPALGCTKPVKTPILPASVDPWTVDATRLRAGSRHVALCGECAAEGTLNCSDCGASGRLHCADCDGGGKVYGHTSAGHQRLLNCRTCRGRGHTKCPTCVRGRVRCRHCVGNKKVDRWLEVEESVRADIQVEPDGEVTRAFVWGKDGGAAPDEQVASDAQLVAAISANGVLSETDLGGRVPADWLAQHWAAIKPRLQPGERVRSQHWRDRPDPKGGPAERRPWPPLYRLNAHGAVGNH